MLRRITLLIAIAFAEAMAWGQEPAGLLTSPGAVRQLDSRTAAQGLPVKATGVVTFAQTRGGSFVLDDGTAAIYVATSDTVRRGLPPPAQDFEGPLQPGMKLEVTGITSAGGFAPVIVPQSFRSLGKAPLPPPVNATVPELQSGYLDCERVRLHGVVQRVAFGERQIDAVRLELVAQGGHFVAYALHPEGFKPADLVDAEVELSGVALAFFNERAEIVGSRVQLQGIEDVSIVRAAPAGPFEAPETSLDALSPFSPKPPSFHRRRVTGTVTLCRPGAYFYIQEGDRAVRVTTGESSRLTPGERVEVSGFIELLEYFAEVREAVFRKVGNAPVPAALPVTYGEVLAPSRQEPPRKTGQLDGRRVVLRGQIDKIEGGSDEGRRISLDCEGHIVFATLANEEPRAALDALVMGSEVAITGICRVELSVGRPTLANPVPTGFELLVQSPAEIAVLRVPSWWTPQRLGIALGGTGLVLAGALGWAWLLRRRVAQRSSELAAEIGARRDEAVEFEATLRERKRLAADLHDTLEQALTGLALQLEAVDLFQKEEPARSTHHLHLARQFLARSREDVRRSVWNLRAQGLEGMTLAQALARMLSTLTDGQEVRVNFEEEGRAVPLPDFIAGNLLLLAQEAVTNAVKHSAAKTITVRLRYTESAIEVQVEDDGSGFDPERAPGMREGHFGLQGMRERIKRLSGTLEIASAPGAGVRICARVPASAIPGLAAGNGSESE